MKRKHKLLGSGLKFATAGIAVGAMPTMGNAQAASIQGNVLGGMSSFSSSFPTVGKIGGTTLVMHHIKKLNKSTHKLIK